MHVDLLVIKQKNVFRSRYGEDLFLIKTCFQDKTDTQLKTKFKAEQKKNATRWNETLNTRVVLDKDEYENHFGSIENGPGSGWEPQVQDATAPAVEDHWQHENSSSPMQLENPTSTSDSASALAIRDETSTNASSQTG